MLALFALTSACGRFGFESRGDAAIDAELLPDASRFRTMTYIKASNTEAMDNFGVSVALSGDGMTLAVGGHLEDSAARGIDGMQGNGAIDSGAVYLYERVGGVWQQQAYVKSANSDPDDQFGWAAALSDDGDTLAVSAFVEDGASPGINGDPNSNALSGTGAVYVFVRSGVGWTQQAYIKASNPGGQDQFGFALALSGDGTTLAVGAINEDSAAAGIGGNQADNTVRDSGAVYVFHRNAAWAQQAYVKATNTTPDDQFGFSVALSGNGNTLAVGAPFEDSGLAGIDPLPTDNTAVDAGAVYTYTRNGSVWSPQSYIKATNPDAGDGFGHAVALSADGQVLAVGAPYEDSRVTGIDGNQMDNSRSASGAVYVLGATPASWQHAAYVKAFDTAVQDNFGWRLALTESGDQLLVGAYSENSAGTGIGGESQGNVLDDSGAAYLLVRDANGWRHDTFMKASNTGAADYFGVRVAMSKNGAVCALGAFQEDSAATGVGGDGANDSASDSGAVYVIE